jgi:hypothetical protein
MAASRLLALCLGLTLMFAACGPRADARTVVEVFLSSREVGDLDGAMSVVADEVTVRAPNELQYKGAGQARQWLQATLNDYSFQMAEPPRMDGGRVLWRDNLYSGSRWVGEIGWEADVADLKIKTITGRVIRGASGIICPQCPPGTRI